MMCIILLKVVMNGYCLKNKGIKEERIMEKKVSRGAFLLLTLCLSLSTVGCKKSNESNKIKEGQSISSKEKGMSTNEKDKNATFKPSDYTLKTKKEYVYEYLGLKFKLSNKFKKYMNDKKIAMLDDQSPIDKELKYAFLTFNKMTKEQKKQLLIKRKVVMKNGKMDLKELELLVYSKKIHQKKKYLKLQNVILILK